MEGCTSEIDNSAGAEPEVTNETFSDFERELLLVSSALFSSFNLPLFSLFSMVQGRLCQELILTDIVMIGPRRAGTFRLVSMSRSFFSDDPIHCDAAETGFYTQWWTVSSILALLAPEYVVHHTDAIHRSIICIIYETMSSRFGQSSICTRPT